MIVWFSVVLRPGGGGGGDTILLDSNSWKIDNNFLYNKQNPVYIYIVYISLSTNRAKI